MDRAAANAALAREIIAASAYMTLATADVTGRPWASPVYYSPGARDEFFWISSPGARHSRNISARRDVSIVIFDSRVAVGAGQGVYIDAVAEELTEHPEFARGVEAYNARIADPAVRGARAIEAAALVAPAPHRLYRATAAAYSILDPDRSRGYDERVPVWP